MNKRSLVQRLENRFGRFAIKNLIIYILLAYVVGYILVIMDSRLHLYDYITMNPEMVMQGQVWRLFTWVCSVPQTLGIFVVFMFIFYYFIGKSLEATLGAFKYNLYMISGWFFMTLGAMVVYWVTTAIYGPGAGMSLEVSTYYLNLASFLAFALLYPNQQVYFFFLIPIKMKWLAIFDVAYLVYRIITYIIALSNTTGIDYSQFGITESYYRAALYAQIFSIIISLLNFVIFYFLIRKVTPKNIRQNIKNAQAQRRRQADWRKNWEESKTNWQNSGYQSGETKWGEKTNARDKTETTDDYDPFGRNDDNKDFMDWADWYDPDMNESERMENRQNYEDSLKKRKEERQTQRESRAERKRRERTSVYVTQQYEHRCEVCGRTNVSDPELSFRFCSKCGGNHEYCEEHIFNHEHKA